MPSRRVATPTRVTREARRLERLEREVKQVCTIAEENRRVLQIQFQRIAALQAQVDHLVAKRRVD